jgi:hypothetical protein
MSTSAKMPSPLPVPGPSKRALTPEDEPAHLASQPEPKRRHVVPEPEEKHDSELDFEDDDLVLAQLQPDPLKNSQNESPSGAVGVDTDTDADKRPGPSTTGSRKARSLSSSSSDVEVVTRAQSAESLTPLPLPLLRTKTPEPDLLSEYNCPICFSPPTNATLTPCGHVLCGSCLFIAVKSAMKRGQAPGAGAEAAQARLDKSSSQMNNVSDIPSDIPSGIPSTAGVPSVERKFLVGMEKGAESLASKRESSLILTLICDVALSSISIGHLYDPKIPGVVQTLSQKEMNIKTWRKSETGTDSSVLYHMSGSSPLQQCTYLHSCGRSDRQAKRFSCSWVRNAEGSLTSYSSSSITIGIKSYVHLYTPPRAESTSLEKV